MMTHWPILFQPRKRGSPAGSGSPIPVTLSDSGSRVFPSISLQTLISTLPRNYMQRSLSEDSVSDHLSVRLADFQKFSYSNNIWVLIISRLWQSFWTQSPTWDKVITIYHRQHVRLIITRLCLASFIQSDVGRSIQEGYHEQVHVKVTISVIAR